MNDLMKCTRFDGVLPVRAVALTDNVPLMTAYANDVDFDQIFVAPLQNLMRSGDILVAFSGSGNSPNVLRACEYARTMQATVVGLCGDPGGRLAEIATHRVIVPAAKIAQQEDCHLVIAHMLSHALRERIEHAAATLQPAQRTLETAEMR